MSLSGEEGMGVLEPPAVPWHHVVGSAKLPTRPLPAGWDAGLNRGTDVEDDWLAGDSMAAHSVDQQMDRKPPELGRNLCSPPAPKLANRSQWSLGPAARLSPDPQMCSLRMRPVAASTERGPSNATSAAPTGQRWGTRGLPDRTGRPARLGRGSPHLLGRWGAGTIRLFVRARGHCVCCLFCLPGCQCGRPPPCTLLLHEVCICPSATG